jgi:site-specific DNA recombinase
MSTSSKPTPRTVAIYCRKSAEERSDSEFTSLDAQRQSCEQFAASQAQEGWVVSPERYDDGGFSGGTTERPALQRLLADIDAGKVQVIAVYKIDRLSRSLSDFVGLLQRLESKQVAFVSVTQHFNTATSLGRLILNILICFAQFERENTIERIRDKVAATKRMGRWCGGVPVLGYDVAPGGRRLLVNEREAEQVREIFVLYREHRTLMATVAQLNARGWTNKSWTTRRGRGVSGRPYSKSSLCHLLKNILYTGRIRYRGEIIAAEHQPIVDLATYEAVQHQIASQARAGGAETRTKHHALLRKLMVCGPCACPMTYCYGRRGPKVYAYYLCARAREGQSASCPMPSIPAYEIERLVVAEIAAICRDQQLTDRVIAAAGVQHDAAVASLRERLQEAEVITDKAGKAARRQPNDATAAMLLRQAETQVATLRTSLMATEAEDPRIPEARAALAAFDPVWAELAPVERVRLLRALVEQISVDGHTGKLGITFRASGIAALAQRGAA